MRIGSIRPVRCRAAGLTLATLLAGAWLPGAQCQSPQPSPRSLTAEERALHLLNRATYGPRPEDVQALLDMGAERWLERQLHPERIYLGPSGNRTPAPAAPSEAATAAVGMMGDPSATAGRTRAELERVMRLRVLSINLRNMPPPDLISSKLGRAVRSPRQLEEVMTDFWFNHFNVFHGKGQVRAALEDYEQVAIRPYVFRRFEDMLIATARHPAMLLYLDNYLSRVPAVDSAQVGGINENYARELLELHTLGVDGGYTQQDVVEVARAFTGWTVPLQPSPRGGPPVPRTNRHIPFDFLPSWHDRGEKVVLGDTLAAGRNMEDGLDVLRALACHPSTARHVATRLVQHFVADDPPAALVDELAAVFLATDGDLRELTRALFTSEAFYDPSHYRAKVKRPYEFVVSALRVTGARWSEPDEGGRAVPPWIGVMEHLGVLGHMPYAAAEPTGYPTVAEDWVSAGAMLSRMSFALELATGAVEGVALDAWAAPGEASPASTLASPERSPDGDAQATRGAALTEAVLLRIVHGVPAAELRSVIADDLARQDATDPVTLAARAIALALGSPEFQRY